MSRKISQKMIAAHLSPVTVGYFATHDIHPSDSADYIPYVAEIKESAEKDYNLDSFKLGLEYYLTQPTDGRDWDLNLGTYAFDNEKMRNLLEIVWETLWPGEALPMPGDIHPDVLISANDDK